MQAKKSQKVVHLAAAGAAAQSESAIVIHPWTCHNKRGKLDVQGDIKRGKLDVQGDIKRGKLDVQGDMRMRWDKNHLSCGSLAGASSAASAMRP